MAIGTYGEDYASDPGDVEGGGWGNMVTWAGALVSAALIGGVAVWGYKLLVRDVSGVPVVAALEGPMRVAPKDPGGMQAEYQDLSVTEVAAAGAEERPTDRVVLAPPPVRLQDEDRTQAELLAQSKVEDLSEGTLTGSAAEPTGGTPISAIELAIAEALEGTGAAKPERTATRVTPTLAGGPLRSPRPVARPAVFRNAVALSSNAAAGLDVSADQVPAGTRMVQLGAFPSVDEARDAWGALDQRFQAYFDGKRRVVQEASAGGSTFYRLRAMGFEDLSDARRFCAVLVAENVNCIPVVRR